LSHEKDATLLTSNIKDYPMKDVRVLSLRSKPEQSDNDPKDSLPNNTTDADSAASGSAAGQVEVAHYPRTNCPGAPARTAPRRKSHEYANNGLTMLPTSTNAAH